MDATTISVAVSVVSLVTVVLGGGVMFGKLKARTEENARDIERDRRFREGMVTREYIDAKGETARAEHQALRSELKTVRDWLSKVDAKLDRVIESQRRNGGAA